MRLVCGCMRLVCVEVGGCGYLGWRVRSIARSAATLAVAVAVAMAVALGLALQRHAHARTERASWACSSPSTHQNLRPNNPALHPPHAHARRAPPTTRPLGSVTLQAVGDALSDLLMVDAILRRKRWGFAHWDGLYTDLPSRQTKLKVHDRTVRGAAGARLRARELDTAACAERFCMCSCRGCSVPARHGVAWATLGAPYSLSAVRVRACFWLCLWLCLCPRLLRCVLRRSAAPRTRRE
jgi:hypothetical protein